MKNTSTLSRITERGQITLPKKIRDSRHFVGAHAVLISEHEGIVTITPVKKASEEQHELLNTAMADWADAEHDELFDFTV